MACPVALRPTATLAVTVALVAALAACGPTARSSGGGIRASADMAAPADMTIRPAGGDMACLAQKPLFCNGRCVNPATDKQNCGRCGSVCGADEVCVNAQCQAGGCPMGTTDCDGTCTDVYEDPDNCGACGTVCDNGQTCSTGKCRCPLGTTLCGGACVDVTSDLANCGACGRACGAGQQCNAGVCSGGNVGSALTGEPCTANADCAKGLGPNQSGVCRKTTGNMPQIMWPGGFCSSACRAGRDGDCPGVDIGNSVAVCDGNTKQCEITCQDHTTDCRAQYVCANIGEMGGLCLPASASGCDPATPKQGCPVGKICVSYSPDESYGQCELTCDPFKQGCPASPQGAAQGCLVDTGNGLASCIPSINENNVNGAACRFLNECAPGFQCRTEGMAGVCRPFCGGPNNVACPGGLACMQIGMIPKATVGLCGK